MQIYYWKILHLEKGKVKDDYTKNVVIPIFIEDKLDETLDTAEIILDNLPISTRNDFPPKTKFRLERFEKSDYTGKSKKWDFIVEHDDVEQYAGYPDICCHRIHLIEASAVAQGMHVDNIALTYELKDVELNYKNTVSTDGNLVTPIADYYTIKTQNERAVFDYPYSRNLNLDKRSEDYFENSYRYVWTETNSLESLLLYQSVKESHEIKFKAPILMCQGYSTGKAWIDLFQVNALITIYKQETKLVEEVETGIHKTEIVGTKQFVTSFQSGPTILPIEDKSDLYYSDGNYAGPIKIKHIEQTSAKSNKAGEWNDYIEPSSTQTAFRISPESNRSDISYTIPALTSSEVEAGKGYLYTIECKPYTIRNYSLVTYYKARHGGVSDDRLPGDEWIDYIYAWIIESVEENSVDPENARLVVEINHQNLDLEHIGGYLTARGKKYSCNSLLRKALLTIDTHILDNDTTSLDEYDSKGFMQPSLDFPIKISESLAYDLDNVKMNETIFENKNLWEVLIQIGYYLHAIPYLEFAEDGTDNFILNFKKLGGTDINNDSSIKITVFNSKNLNEYFTAFDSYVSNFFSPQNIVEEWIVPKTSDNSYLVSNNTAELHLTYGITELLEFDIVLLKNDGKWESRDALKYIFEKSIYEVLSNDNSYEIYPCKGNSLFFALGDNKVLGLNFVPPSANSGDLPMALKRIVEMVWQGENIPAIKSMKYNDLRFRVKYRTQDNLRITQFRPDLQKFMKNSELEKYPHHEQFYGQQDKIVDSERFTTNLFGKLIRVGNNIFQRQEYVINVEDEKEAGQIVNIEMEPYYITAIESEYYPDAIFQKVTYSKDFNQLSNIVTIPSEPRFYEVSERSKIRREVRLMEFFTLSTNEPSNIETPKFLNNWKTVMKNLLFDKERELPNFAFTEFRADKKRLHIDSHNAPINKTNLFPSSLLEREDGKITPLSPSDHSDCIVPVLHFPIKNGIVFEWDMHDNFKVGDFIDDHVFYENKTSDEAYLSLQPLRYCDVYGRADLFTFKLFKKNDWTPPEIQKLPRAVLNPDKPFASVSGSNNMAIALEKDCREELSFNYQINLLHDDEFITTFNLFGEKDSDLKCVALKTIQNKFTDNVEITDSTKVSDIVFEPITNSDSLEIIFKAPANWDDIKSQVNSIVFYQENTEGGTYAYMIRNVDKLLDDEKLNPWYIYPVYND